MRVDANVSVRRRGAAEFGTRCEIKNMNSLRSLGRAIEYEFDRQVALLEAGEPVAQQTRHWDEDAAQTVSLRSKEEAFDYRYFPEPDLVPLAPDPAWQAEVAAALGTLPADRREKLGALFGPEMPTGARADQIATVVEHGLDELVLDAAATGVDPALALARTANEYVAADESFDGSESGSADAATRAAADNGAVTRDRDGAGRDGAGPHGARRLDARRYSALLRMEQDGQLSAKQVKTVLAEMLSSGGDPAEIARRRGFEALGTDELSTLVADAIAANPAEWERYCAGEDKLVGFFTGAVMRATSNRANGKAVADELRRRRG